MMGQLGLNLTLQIGQTVPIPAPPPLVEALQDVEITHRDEGRSGFQITFRVGRSGAVDLLDYGLVASPLLRPFNRVILTVALNVVPQVLMDGVITHHQLAPSSKPGASTLTVTGEDVSVMMDLREKSFEHPGQAEPLIVTQLLTSYAAYGVVPEVTSPPALDTPLPMERTPVYRGTDYGYVREMARRYGYVFYIAPGPAPGSSTAYWGPPRRAAVPQPALSVNLGADTNVDSIDFRYAALDPALVSGWVRDARLGVTVPVETVSSSRFPPLAGAPALAANLPHVRTRLLDAPAETPASALARAQATTDTSTDAVVTAQGELHPLRYGSLLQARGVVGMRGAGHSHDGHYYVKSVTHSIRQGDYRQRFTLTREGLRALSPVVRP